MSINSPANQYALDPRQKTCWEFYVDPKSETFANALRSALRAGYEESYARTMTDTDWFRDRVRRLNMLSKAEKVLEKALDYPTENSDGEVNVPLLAVQTKVATTVATTMGKNEGWSSKGEDAQDKMAENIKASPESIAIAKRYEEELKGHMN